MTIQEYYKPVEKLPEYGLKPGDRLNILKGSGCVKSEPDWIEVVAEYTNYILCEYFYQHWTGRIDSYKHCLNKVNIITGDVSFQVVDSCC